VSTAAEKLSFLLDLQEHLGGAIPFERWMREALYHETFGYYSATIRAVGTRGDFTTWPQQSQNLGHAIARWARTHRPKHLIEVGAGSGELAAAVLRGLGWWGRPRYHIVEISRPLREAQQKLLGRKAEWHATIQDALAACQGDAVIISNELVDAFPCRIFEKQPAGWRELALRIENGKVLETWIESPLPESTAFAHAWPDGQRVEVAESYHHWRNAWRDAWKNGAMLTIDYGDFCPALYHRRPRGTLRAYAHHHRLEGTEAYAGFGLRDLTVDVNFSDLQKWAGASAQCLSLGTFLASLQNPPEPAFQEAGEAFKVFLEPLWPRAPSRQFPPHAE